MKIMSFRDVEKDSQVIFECASLYCQIWKEPPWNEDFWRIPEVIKDINVQLGRNCAEGFLALNGSREVIGFTWGYPVSKNNMRKISDSNSLDYVFERRRKVFYVDELGVGSSFRIRGVGMALSEKLISAIKWHGARSAILRTDERAVAARILYEKLGFCELEARDGKYGNRTYWLLDV